VLEVVARVAEQVKVTLLTNNGRLLREEFARIAPEVAALPGVEFFVSGALGIAKPDPAVFQLVAERCGAAVEATLFVDDSAEYVESARQAGARAHVFDCIDGLRRFLTDAGLSV